MVVNAANMWNRCPELRAAKTLGEARGVAKRLAAGVPILRVLGNKLLGLGNCDRGVNPMTDMIKI
jgi:hypothetical protein